MQSLDHQFTQAMFDIYRHAKTESGYNCDDFLQMISDRGGVDTAKKVINASKPPHGYTHLYDRGYLNLTAHTARSPVDEYALSMR
jgi:hypothetical protein